MAGIEETKDLAKFIVELAEGGAKALEDKKFSLSDIQHFVSAVGALPAAIAGIGQIPAELKDMDVLERQELVDFIKAEFDIPQDNVEEIAEAALDVCIDIFKLVMKIIAISEGPAEEATDSGQ